jgi:hypothetical protein
MLFRELNAGYTENDKKHIHTLCGQNAVELLIAEARDNTGLEVLEDCYF